jgi:hypothetical protein
MRPVLVTDHPELLDNCLRIAAAVGVEIELVPDVGTVRARWGGGSLVLVGADVAQRVALAAPTRRSGVIVVAVEEPDAAIWQAAVPWSNMFAKAVSHMTCAASTLLP